MIESLVSSERSLLVTLEEIGQVLATNGRPTESLQNIVGLIRERFGTDVCSVYLLEPDQADSGPATLEPHSMNPTSVLSMVRPMGSAPARILVVGCEPACLESEDGNLALSEPVARAVDEAVALIESLVSKAMNPELQLH